MSATYQLVIRSGAGAGKVLPLDKSELHVGRDVTNDLVISDEKVSRRHARLYSEGDQYVVEDLGSTNGTFINGARLSGPHLLRAGEQITFGETSIVSYERTEEDPNATVMSTFAATPATVTPPKPAAGSEHPTGPRKGDQGYISSQAPLARNDFDAAPAAASTKKKSNTVLIIILIIVALFICICAGAFFYIDSQNLYCSVAPFLFPGCAVP
jgi:pSer/pThr/pTyr-binding forkhead associated (FHA) protein